MVIWLLASYSAANEWWAATTAVESATAMSGAQELVHSARLYQRLPPLPSGRNVRDTVHASVCELDTSRACRRGSFDPGQQLPRAGAPVADALREIVGRILEDDLAAGDGPGKERRRRSGPTGAPRTPAVRRARSARCTRARPASRRASSDPRPACCPPAAASSAPRRPDRRPAAPSTPGATPHPGWTLFVRPALDTLTNINGRIIRFMRCPGKRHASHQPARQLPWSSGGRAFVRP